MSHHLSSLGHSWLSFLAFCKICQGLYPLPLYSFLFSCPILGTSMVGCTPGTQGSHFETFLFLYRVSHGHEFLDIILWSSLTHLPVFITIFLSLEKGGHGTPCHIRKYQSPLKAEESGGTGGHESVEGNRQGQRKRVRTNYHQLFQ